MQERGAAPVESRDRLPAFNMGGNRCLSDDAEIKGVPYCQNLTTNCLVHVHHTLIRIMAMV